MSDELTDKQRVFCIQYAKHKNSTRAAKEAGYSQKTAHAIGWENLKKPYIINYLNNIGLNILDNKDFTTPKKEGYIYLVKYKGTCFYKIGKTSNSVYKRIKALQVATPFEVELVVNVIVDNALLSETNIHDTFEDKKIRGEWFYFRDNQIDSVIKKLKSYER